MDSTEYRCARSATAEWCVRVALSPITPPHSLTFCADEPVELKQIQDSLISHVNLDPAAAIGVLCDHCSLDPDLAEEDKNDREKLRKLVLFFLANTAKKDIYVHLRGPTSEVEQVFRDGLVKVGALC